MMRMPNQSALQGSTISRIMTLGIAPMKGPKNGITLVAPTTALMSSASGMRSALMHTKHSTPMMALSISLPLIKPANTPFAWPQTLRKRFALGVGISA